MFKRRRTAAEVKTTKNKQKRGGATGPLQASGRVAGAEIRPVNREQEKLIEWMQTVKFRKVLIGGLDEAQVWKKLEELNQLYDAAIRAERARYDALLGAHKEASNTLLHKYKRKLAEQSSERSRRGAGGETNETDRGREDASRQNT